MIVYREDRKTLALLGGLSAVKAARKYQVREWIKKGNGKFQKYEPLAFDIPDSDLPENWSPMTENEAANIRSRRSNAGKKATYTHKKNISQFCVTHDLTPGIGLAAMRGEVEIDVAKKISKIAQDRHELTDYDNHLKSGMPREDARELARQELSEC